MPDEEKKQEQPEEEAEQEGELTDGTAPKKKSPNKIVLLIAGVLVLVVLGAVGYLVFAPSSQASPDENGDDAVATENGESGEETGSDSSSRRSSRSSRSRGSDENVESTDIFLSDFPASVVNLGPSEKFDYVYLKYGFNLELGDMKVRAEIGKKMPKLIAVVDATMGGHSWDKIGNARGREGLAGEVVEALNAELETGEIVACHFITFVAQ